LYAADSLYPVKLVFTTSKGCKDSITQNVRIYPITNPGFIFDTSCVNSPVYFEDTTHYFYTGDTIRSRIWSWGDGSPNTISVSTTNHTYLSAGTYTVTLAVQTDSGCTQYSRRNVIVHSRPIIITSNDTFLCPGSTTQIAASGGVNYRWTPSATLSDTTISNPISTTSNDIVYFVNVADVNSCQNIDSVKVTMYTNHADFNFTNECQDTAVQFRDLSTTTGGIINQWRWTFGDSLTDIIQNPIHLYGMAGSYTAKLVFMTNRGCEDSIEKTLMIYPIPNLGFIFDSTCLNSAIYFTDTTHYFYTGDTIISRSWTWGDGSPTATSVPTINHTYTSIGNYNVTLTVTSDSGCTQRITKVVRVHPLPIINLLHDTTICPNLTVQYIAQGGSSFFWNADSTLNDTSIYNPIASPVSDNTYRVRVADSNRCQNRDSAHITVFIIHPVSAGLDTSVCLSPTSFFDSAQLTGSGGVAYEWTPAYNISNTSIYNPWVAPDTNTNYTAMITDINGCIQFDTVRVVVLDPALDILTAKDTFLCKNDTIKIRVIDQGVDGYTWTPVLNLNNPTVQSPRFYPTDTTTYYVQVLNYCYTKKDTMQFFVYDLPVPNFTYDTTCIHSAVNFTDISLGTLRGWLWIFGDDSSSILQNPVHTYNRLGTLTVRLIDTTNLGCYDSISKSITIHPTPILQPLRDTILCQNKFTTFQTSPGMRYFWSPAIDLDNPNISNPTTIVSTNGTYTVIVSDSNRCQSFDTVSTTYDLLFPRFVAENKCKDTLVHFSDSSTAVSGIISSWRWDFGDGYSSYDHHPSHLYGSAGVFNVNLYFETSNGCDTNYRSTVTVYPLPVLNPDKDTICLGDSYQIIADSTYTLIWSANPTLSSLTSYRPIANPTVTTNYYVSLKDTNFCVNKDTFTLQVNYKPNVYITSPTTFFCKGDTVLLEAHTSARNVIWTPANLLSDSTSLTTQAILADTLTYFANVIDDAGCSNIDSITLFVQQPPTALAFMNDTICRGTTVTLFANGGKYYHWMPSDYLDNSLTDHVKSTPDSTIQYTINVSNDCFSDDTIVTVYVHQLPKANAGSDVTIYRNESTTLSASGGIYYSWFPSDLLQNPEGAFTNAAPLFTTNYSVMVTDINGCIAYDTVLVRVEANSKIIIPTAFSPDGNGVNDIFRISKTLNIERLITFEVYDRWGNLIFSTTDMKSGWDGTYNNREQPIGSYTWLVKALDYDGGSVTRTGVVTLLR
jgi:gliding motility-associated-like protein